MYSDRHDPIVFLPIVISTSGRVYDDFTRLLFLHVHREASIWPENCLRNRNSFVSFIPLPRFLNSRRVPRISFFFQHHDSGTHRSRVIGVWGLSEREVYDHTFLSLRRK
jgi:hypothetical protein